MNRTRPELRLEVRAGVCTGEVVVTLDAAPGEPLATGDVVNTAARLQSAATPGRVIVGEGTHRLTERVFTFEEIDPIRAKDELPVGHTFKVLMCVGGIVVKCDVQVRYHRTPGVPGAENLSRVGKIGRAHV